VRSPFLAALHLTLIISYITTTFHLQIKKIITVIYKIKLNLKFISYYMINNKIIVSENNGFGVGSDVKGRYLKLLIESVLGVDHVLVGCIL